MPEEKILKTKIDSSILAELGKMYTTITQTIRELVQNSFDAFANNIYITVDIPGDYIEVMDDGHGMNDYVVENHYINVGMSTKIKVIEQMPSIPPELDKTRPKIGRKGMGKLSWVLVAKEMETITTSIDIPHAIKVNFYADDLETNKISHTEKTFKHGTYIKFTRLQNKDVTDKDIVELENTIGFLHHAFPAFHIYLTVNSPTTKMTKKLIVKTLAKGYELKKKAIYEYKRVKPPVDIPYDFVIRLPTEESKKIAEFWLLSGYMGVKKIDILKKFSGYLNIENIELVANRNDIQSLEMKKFEDVRNDAMDYFFDQLELIAASENYSKMEFIDINKDSLTSLIYNLPSGHEGITKHFKFDFYGIGTKRLINFLETENAIYYYSSSIKYIADKASYYGYKCFLTTTWEEEYCVRNAFDTAFVQKITDIPKEAYEFSGATIKPVGKLSDILKNASKIFDSLTYAYNKITAKVEELKRELEEPADALTEEEKKTREKELKELMEKLEKLKKEFDKGKKEEGETEEKGVIEEELPEKKKKFKSLKKKAFKQNEEHYIEMSFGEYKLKIAFVFIDDQKVIATIYMYKYIHLNVNNEYIKTAIEEKDPAKQLILLTPHMCHEIAHFWSSEHDESFQMAFNGLLIPALDNLLKTIRPEEFITEIKKEPEFKVKPKIKLTKT